MHDEVTPAVSAAPQTIEGWYALHDMRRIDWRAWKRLDEAERRAALQEAAGFLARCERAADAPEGGSAFYAVAGHKADLMFLHLRPSLDHLVQVELAFHQTRLADFTERVSSYTSVIELSRYNPEEPGEAPPPEREAALVRRLKPAIPAVRYACFYPMSKKRGEIDNWYTLPMEKRRELMYSHGMIGRGYKGQVTQMVTGSVGLDDWEWGVTLFADDPLPFKKLVYEMRFDEASAKYGLFGPFWVGVRLSPAGIEEYMAGRLPGREPTATA